MEMELLFLIFLLPKILIKKMMCNRNNFGRFNFFNCKKSFVNAYC